MVPESAVSKLRQATAHEGEVVVDLIAAMLLEMASHGGHILREQDHVRSRLRERFMGSLQQEDHTYLVAPMEGKDGDLAGVVEASVVSPSDIFREERAVHVHALYVRPSHRRLGLGRAMLEAALSWGRGKGCAEAELSVLTGNPARQLYRQLGFKAFELEMRLRL